MIMETNTLILSSSDTDLSIAGDFIRNGEVVAIPTETVYGLGADATNATAVRKVFEAKGRPADNPLIVHISDLKMFEQVAYDIPHLAYKLAEHFWPGPLTMIVPKRSIIPNVTSGNLSTVGVRMPSNEIARKIIKFSGRPIAAPSANISGYPSPTTAQHVINDMNGKISAIVDGGECTYGLESTVISFDNFETVRILRPGYITKEQLEKYVETVIIDNAVLKETNPQTVASPGMKYKHYSPKARVIIVKGTLPAFSEYVSHHLEEHTSSLIFDGDAKAFPFSYKTFGDTSEQQGKQLFAKLREFDDEGIKKVFVRCPSTDGFGLAVYNRLIRSAGFDIEEV